MNHIKYMLFAVLLVLGTSTCTVMASDAIILPDSSVPLPTIDISVGSSDAPEEINRSLQILLFMTLIVLSPYLLLMMTSFARIIISLHFLRAAMGTQQMPPNQVMIGLALFLTMFMMGPTMTQINEGALTPYNNGVITQGEALTAALRPIREFMFSQLEPKELDLFSELANIQPYDSYEQMIEELPNSVLIPSFLIAEITKGFKIGVILYIPFIVIDMVVASTLMAMGMMMLPPAMISLPFKILFFVMVDGWELVIQGILMTFY